MQARFLHKTKEKKIWFYVFPPLTHFYQFLVYQYILQDGVHFLQV